MKILFATPPVSREERYGSLAGAGSSAPSLGILLLAAVARQKGWSVSVLEAAALNLGPGEALARIEAERPEVLGISTTTLSVFHAHELAEAAKKALPGLRTLIGGPHVSAVPLETMERFTAFDLAVVGEGEQTLSELLDAFAEGGSLEGVRGIVRREGGAPRVNPPRPFLKDLDRLPPPAWDLLEGFPRRYAPAPFKTRRLPAASLVTSRGCPNKCIFCDRSVFGARCHGHSAAYVTEMMEDLHRRHGVREFAFEDDTFVTFGRRLREICEGLIASKAGFSWTCLGRVDHVSPENLALMKRAGCWQVSFGIESGSQAILDAIGKRVTLEQIRDAVRMTRKAGILAKGFFIVGHPGETRETLEATVRFALELPLNDLSVTMLTPFPGTELYDRAAEFGAFDDDWRRLNLLTPVFVPEGLIAEDLLRAQRELTRRFYLRSRVIADYGFRAARNPGMVGGLLSGFRALVFK